MFRTFLGDLKRIKLADIMLMFVVLVMTMAPGMLFLVLLLLSLTTPTGASHSAIVPISIIGLISSFMGAPYTIMIAVMPPVTDEKKEEEYEACEYALCECARHNLPPFFNFTTRAWETQPCGNESCLCLEHTNQEKFVDGKWVEV